MISLISKDTIDVLTGEVKTVKSVHRYNTNANIVPSNSSEVNSGVYLVDDRDYVSLSDLIQRTKRSNVGLYKAMMNGDYADNQVFENQADIEDYLKETSDFINDTELEISRPGIAEGVESGEPAVESQGEPNLADTDPNAVDLSTANG